MGRTAAALAFAASLMVQGCGGGGAEEPAGVTPDVPHLRLEVTDTVGVELGDSCYVFGTVTDAGRTPGGGVVVLDQAAMRIRLYGPDGAHVVSVGSRGSGPGELQMPRAMTVLGDGGIAVSDVMGGELELYDDSLGWARAVTGFFPRPPVELCASGDSSVVGMLPAFDREAGMMGYSIALLEGSAEPSVVYLEEMLTFDPSLIGPMGEERRPRFTTGPDGRVAVSRPGTRRMVVSVFDREGSLLFELDEAVTPVEKTEEELALEETEFEEFASRMQGRGRFGAGLSFDPEELRPAVGGLGCDSLGRTWVRMGGVRHPCWRVYDDRGELVLTASLELDDPDIDRMEVGITPHGAVAWVPDPSTWPRLLLLDL